MLSSIHILKKSLQRGSVSPIELVRAAKANGVQFQWHPLGFVIGKLLQESEQTARLHIWLPGGMKAQSVTLMVHDHVFSFTSWVLAGTIENVEYKIDTSGTEYALYLTEYSGHVSVLKKSGGTLRLVETARVQYRAGSSYSVPVGQLHETSLVGLVPAVTVLLTKATNHTSPRVAGPGDGHYEYTFSRTELSDEELHAVERHITLASPARPDK